MSARGIVEAAPEPDREIPGNPFKARRRVPVKYAVIALTVIVVSAVPSFVWLQSVLPPSPPVDVYSKPSPPEGTQMLSIFPSAVLDNPCTDVKCQNGTGINITTANTAVG